MHWHLKKTGYGSHTHTQNTQVLVGFAVWKKRFLGMARHMRQVFKFENFKNQVGLDFKFFFRSCRTLDLTFVLMNCQLCLGMVWLWDPFSKPRPSFFCGFQWMTQKTHQIYKKIKIIKSKVTPRIKYNMLHLNLNYF